MLQALEGGRSPGPIYGGNQGSKLVLRGQSSLGLPRWLSGKESTRQFRNLRFDPWVGEDLLEKEMATHSSTLAWEISWTEEPGPLQSMESQKSLTGLSDETTQTQVF